MTVERLLREAFLVFGSGLTSCDWQLLGETPADSRFITK